MRITLALTTLTTLSRRAFTSPGSQHRLRPPRPSGCISIPICLTPYIPICLTPYLICVEREEPLPQEVCGCRLMPFVHLCDPDDLNLSIPSQVHLPFVKFVQAWRPQKKEGVLSLLCTHPVLPACSVCVWVGVGVVPPALGRMCDVLNPHTQSVGTEPPCALRFCVYSPSLAFFHTAAVGISIVTPLPTAGVGRCKASVGEGVFALACLAHSACLGRCGVGGVVCGPQYGQTARTDR